MRKEKPSNGENLTLKEQQTKLRKNLKKKIKEATERGYVFFTDTVGEGGAIKQGTSYLELPDAEANPTPETIEKLKDISEHLYERAIWFDPHFDPSLPEYEDRPNHTGVWSGIEGRKIERTRASRKGWDKRKNRVLDDPDDSAPDDRYQPPPDEPVWEPIFDTIRAYLLRLEQERGDGPPAAQEARERSAEIASHWFDSLIEEHEVNATVHSYAIYLQSKAKEISMIVDDMIADSESERISGNATKLLNILNEEPLSLNQYEIMQEYMMGLWDITE